jgi:hypothetical protein
MEPDLKNPDPQKAEESARDKLSTGLAKASIPVRSKYLSLLREEVNNFKEKNGDEPVEIGCIRSVELFTQAEEIVRQEVLGKMEGAWDKATTKEGRPPIGGAQDD